MIETAESRFTSLHKAWDARLDADLCTASGTCALFSDRLFQTIVCLKNGISTDPNRL